MADDTDAATRQKTTRLNVSVPTELLERARAAHPDLSPSAALQGALRTLAGCEHEYLACARCGAPVRQGDVAEDSLSRYYVDLLAALAKHLRREGTAEGFGRVLKTIAEEHGVRRAGELPLPTLTRAERRSAKIKEFPSATRTAAG